MNRKIILRIGFIVVLALFSGYNKTYLRQFIQSASHKDNGRKLSVDLGGCEWVEAQPLGRDVDSFGTILASYPGSGMRFTWQHVEGITGIQVGDDFHLGGEGAIDRSGIMKTQYPHLEGIWSWNGHLDQNILLIRNPRWAMPSYHTFLYEVNYAHDWQTAYQYLNNIYTRRPASLDAWIKFRDYRFDDEIKLWRWLIDFWMEGGKVYWDPWDYERNGQWPFSFRDEEDKANWPIDEHCLYPHDQLECTADVVIAYEALVDPTAGPNELRKIANLIRGKPGMSVIGDEVIDCMYHETERHKRVPDMSNRDNGGLPADAFTFTIPQMEKLIDNIRIQKNKYSSGVWVNNSAARDMVGHLDAYIVSITTELNEMLQNPAPTPAPNAAYQESLASWYKSIGKGDRYNKAKVQTLAGFWLRFKHLYE